MRRLIVLAAIAFLGVASPAGAQARQSARRPAPAPPPPPSPPIKVAPEVICATPLGVGVTSKLAFCDIVIGQVPVEGMRIKLPPHSGPVTLTFDLHNRHTYSEDQVRANRAFARYTATIGVMAMDNTLLTRAAVQSEFRKAADLIDRIGGGAGPGGLKAVAPTGVEHITVVIPEGEDQVSLLGEKLTVESTDGSPTYTTRGRPIALVSNVMIEYVEPPPLPPARGRAGRAGGAGR